MTEGVVLLSATTTLACAADAGDPAKTLEDGTSALDGASGGGETPGDDGTSNTGQDATVGGSASGGGSSSGTGSASGSSGSAGSSGGDAGGPADDGSTPDAVIAPLVDGAACLMDTGTCPVCATQNAGDVTKCMQYLTCYETNGCNPHTSCGAMDAVCGVNTIGGGNAPQTAAIATFDCACH
jgi:hypothetical protein